ncbi:MAG: CCA tRNA nucleotidyltransferase [Thermoplasmatota archaeon]
MTQFKAIEKKVLATITPTTSDRKRLQETIQHLQTIIKKELINRNINASIELVGSTAKDTYLKNSLDIDLFLLYPYHTRKESMAKSTLSIGKQLLEKTEECYAEHPYIRGMFNQYEVELVPCYNVEHASQKLSAVDRTPFHTRYVKQKITEDQKQEIRLFKQFLKGISCYGAEAQIQGFSGYLCELFVIKYGSFQNIIKQAKTWIPGKKITLGSQPIPVFPEPLTFIDPVDPERNVASAISLQTLKRFIVACDAYLKKPHITFFFPNSVKPWDMKKIKEQLEQQKYHYVGITFDKPDILDENLYPQLRKTIRSITTACETYDFSIHDIRFFIHQPTKKVYIIIQTDPEPLPATYTHMGPPKKLTKNTKEFLEKWKNHPDLISKPFEKNGRTYVIIKRTYQNLDDFLRDIIPQLSKGKHLDEIMQHDFKILSHPDLLRKDLAVFWTKYLDGKHSWER